MKSTLIVLGALCLVGGAMAQPAVNVSASKHPHLAAAQQECLQAWDRLVAAQKANDWDMAGSAQKAKDLLVQTGQELKRAADAANKNANKPKPGGEPGGAEPAVNVSAQRHPNLAAAQELCRQAWQEVVAAQAANAYDMEGHAQKAKELLAEASGNIKAAALAANAHH